MTMLKTLNRNKWSGSWGDASVGNVGIPSTHTLIKRVLQVYILGAHWPTSTVGMVSSRLSKKPYLTVSGG